MKLPVIIGLAIAALLIHGYHYGIEDEAIYLPAIKKFIEPALYPHDSQFFVSQTQWTIVPRVVAWITRISHVPLPWVALFAHFASICLLLLGCSRILALCFPKLREQIGGMALFTALLTLPVAGISLYLADQHLHPRTWASAFSLLSISAVLSRRYWWALAAALAALVSHPLMAVYGISFAVLLVFPSERWSKVLALLAMPPWFVPHPSAAWQEALATRAYLTVRNWEWYEWAGLWAPFAVIWWLKQLAKRQGLVTASRVIGVLFLYAAILCAVTLAISLPRTDFLWPLQPFRYLHTVYVLMILVGGGLLARLVLQNHLWRWALVLVPLCAVMLFVQRAQFASSRHIDLPGLEPVNVYVKAFLWARNNAPPDAFFALDPEYMKLPHEDYYAFRALAERSRMADISKDAAVVTVAPQLAPEWKRQVDALRAWKGFSRADLARLRRDFGVTWVVLEAKRAQDAGFDCPYSRDGVAVCRTPAN